MKTFALTLALAGLLLTGCSQNAENSPEAVRQGIISYLAGVAGLDISQMDVEVSAVSFGEDSADATVSIRPRGATDPMSGMQMSYSLERQGNRWVVTNRSETGSPHGEGMMGSEMPAGEMPPGHPSMSEMPSGETAPPGEAE